MPLLTSLLTAIARADGDALVLHSGERPYVVAPSGQSPLSAKVLTLDAMTGMLRELLPEDLRRVLDEVGAVQHDLTNPTIAAGERFAVVAARGGDDIWIEIRRHRAAPVDTIVEQWAEALSEPQVQSETSDAALATFELIENESDVNVAPDAEYGIHEISLDGLQLETPVVEPPPLETVAAPTSSVEPMMPSPDPVMWSPEAAMPSADQEMWSPEPVTSSPDPVMWVPEPVMATPDAAMWVPEPVAPSPEPVMWSPEPVTPSPDAVTWPPEPEPVMPSPEPVMWAPEPVVAPPEPVMWSPEPVMPSAQPALPPFETGETPQPQISVPPATPAPVAVEPRAQRPIDAEPHPAVVVPLGRSHVRDLSRERQTIRFAPPQHTAGIDRLLRVAAARGASTLYLTSQARPSVRINGEISPMDGEPVLSEPDVEAMMLEIVPETNREALRNEAGTEWICDVPDVGRIRCVTFRDHRGAGGIFRMISARAISAEQLGLSQEIQNLCDEASGLVLVVGPRSSGKTTLISAFVDLINRTRSDHVVTLEHQIKFVHENRGSLVSQREVRGDHNEWMTAARAALRENPDVLVIEDLSSPEIVALALEAAQSEQLVIGAVTAHTTTEALHRILEQTPPDRRSKIQLGLAGALRGVVAQVLLRKSGGGRVAAREVLLNTPAVANLIAEGKTSQLPMSIDGGRRHGMVALNDALVAFVQGGVVDSREAYRHASDQQGLLTLLQRQGIDTSFVERLA